MASIRKNIPNLLTSFNLLSGVIGLALLIRGNLPFASMMVLIAGIFDFLDGMVARLLSVKSLLGKELYSLADVVSFGVLPGFILYHIVISQNLLWPLIAFPPLLIPVFAALRLAKFNIDRRQEEEFRGLPTPAMAIFIASLEAPYGFSTLFLNSILSAFLFHPLTLSLLALLLCFMMISEIPLFSLKMKSFSFKEYPYPMVFLCVSLMLVLIFKTAGLGFSILTYVFLSLVKLLFRKRE